MSDSIKTGMVFTPQKTLGTVVVENACDKKPHPRNRKSDRGVARHVTLGMFIAFIAAVFGPIVAMQAWTIQVANEAKIAAASARPYPYTSIDAKEAWERHMSYHRDHDVLVKNARDATLGRIEERLSAEIKSLPRPPPQTIRMLNDLLIRITRLEVLIKKTTEHDSGSN